MASKSNIKQIRNILLLGEAGAGKSTLINAFANYSAYGSFKKALEGDEIPAQCLIPTKYSVYDDNLKETIVSAGRQEDDNENMEPGQSGTLSCKSYVFDLSNELGIRFIDTSGFADTKGPEHDMVNLEDILDYVVQFQKIDAFAFVMEANQTNETRQTKDFLYQIFSKLGKDALQNVIFIFTHGKRPQNGLQLTKSAFEKLTKLFNLPKVINFEKKKIFCFENEPFRELLAVKNGYKTTNESEIKNNESQWAHSTAEFQRLLTTVFEMVPYTLDKPLTGQNAVEFIRSVSVISGIILSNIDDNLSNNFPWITHIKITPQENALSMCLSHKKCKFTNGEMEQGFKIFGRNICCGGCHLNFGQRSCKRMNFITAKCKKCNCNLKKHVFFYYNVSLEKVEISNEDAVKYLNNLQREKTSIINFLEEIIDNIDISDKVNYSGETSEEDKAYGYSKHLFRLSWKGIPSENISKIKAKLENLPTLGSIIKEACETNENNNKTSKQKRDKKVKNINKVFFKRKV